MFGSLEILMQMDEPCLIQMDITKRCLYFYKTDVLCIVEEKNKKKRVISTRMLGK